MIKADPVWNIRARSAGEFPWPTSRQWVKDAGPFIRDVEFNIVAPIRAYEPMVSVARRMTLRWDYLVQGRLNVRVLPGAGAAVTTARVVPTYPPAQVPAGLLLAPFQVGPGAPWPYLPIGAAVFDGHCQRANAEANRLRQTYLPAVPPPGAPGLTGFTLRDLRSIAKSFSEPSVYVIQD